MATSIIKKDVSIKGGVGIVTVPAGGDATVDISFSNPYPQGFSYAVTISQSGSGPSSNWTYADITCGTINRTNTGFKALLSSTRVGDVTVNFMWCAVPLRS